MSIGTIQRPERGLRYALAGGAAITLLSILVGGGLFAWLMLAARGPSAPDLLPADTQLYAALTPNIGGVVEVEQLREALREGFGVADPEAMLPAIERKLGVSLAGNVGTWLGSEIAVAARGLEPGDVYRSGPAVALLRDGEVLFFFGSKNDPQAAAFLEKVRAAREGRGETITAVTRGEVTIFAREGGEPDPTAAFALIDHYVVFSNSRAALEALEAAGGDQASALAGAPGFGPFQKELTPRQAGAVYTDGTTAAELARAALRVLLSNL